MKPDELIEELGGSAAVAERLGIETNTVGNWRKRRVPAWAIPALNRMCSELGIDPGNSLTAQPPRRAPPSPRAA